MKISVKTLKGEIFPVNAELNETVAALKQKIQEAKGADMAADRQKLIHSGKVLKDEQTVAELGLAESDFIVCMVTKEVAKKPASAPAAAAAPAPAAVTPSPAAPQPVPTPATPAVQPAAPPAAPRAPARPTVTISPEAVAALTGMGFPEAEVRAALTAAMGNPDMAYEFLLTGIPDGLAALAAAPPVASPAAPAAAAPSAGAPVSIEVLRQHPQFNMLKQVVQQNPAALSQVLDLIGAQSPDLLAAIHANNEAFIAMMNEPIVDTPAPAPVPQAPPAAPTGPLGDPAQMMQMLAALPAPQRAQFAQSMGLSPQQFEGFMQMMAQMPPEELNQMLSGGMGADPPNVIRLTEEEMAAVNRLVALGFSQQQAAQAYMACDKNEALAANLLLEGGWMDDDEGDMGGDFGGDDAYN